MPAFYLTVMCIWLRQFDAPTTWHWKRTSPARCYGSGESKSHQSAQPRAEGVWITSSKENMTEYKSRMESEHGYTSGDVNDIRLADLAVLREWAKETTPIFGEGTRQWKSGYNAAINGLLSFITSCEAKLK